MRRCKNVSELFLGASTKKSNKSLIYCTSRQLFCPISNSSVEVNDNDAYIPCSVIRTNAYKPLEA